MRDVTVITPQTVQALNPALLRFALRLVRHPEEAEDLVQETWSSALRGAANFEGRSSLRTWLNGIMRRRAADRYRRERRTERLDDDLARDLAQPVSERLEQHVASAMVSRALCELPPLERMAVTLCDVEDIVREEAADQLGVTRGHLRVLLHRGRQKVQLRLQKQGIERVA